MSVVQIDGERVEVRDGATLGDLLGDRDPSCAVAVIRPAVAEAEQTRSLSLGTSSGEVVVEGTDPRSDLLTSPTLPLPLRLQWADRYVAAFGPFSTDLVPDKKTHLYERGDVILGSTGYDNRRSALVFSRMRHVADHGAAADGGVIGRVVSGRGLIDRWTAGDTLERVARQIAWADRSRSFSTTDRATRLEDGMQIVTKVAVIAEGYRPGGEIETANAEAVEHLLLALQDGRYRVWRAASTHVRDEGAIHEDVPAAHRRPRREGAVTARASGPSRGAIYIYRADLPASSAHTLVGQVSSGIELVKLAEDGDLLCLSVTPPRLDFLGLAVPDAVREAESHEASVQFDTSGEDRIVVSQSPSTTLEALAAGKIELGTAPVAKVVDIVLDDARAPLTCQIFRKMTGLDKHRVGQMPLVLKFEDVFLFRPNVATGFKVIPENTPTDEVPADSLAMTNDSRKGAGVVGIRLRPNREFGPTAEPFEGTNLIGSVVDPKNLAKIKEREVVYVREVKP